MLVNVFWRNKAIYSNGDHHFSKIWALWRSSTNLIPPTVILGWLKLQHLLQVMTEKPTIGK